MTRHSDIAVVYCSDRRYFPGLAASLLSLRHFHPDVPVVVISWDLAPEQESWIAHRARVVPRESDLPDDPCWGRLGILRMALDRAVYLDADTIVTGPIDALWQTTAPIAVARNLDWPITTNFRGMSTLDTLGLPHDLPGFNTGVVSFRPPLVGSALYGHLLDLHARYGEDFLLGDQSAFHLALYGNTCAWEWLPDQYNGIAEFWSWEGGAPRIVHYAGPLKPWDEGCPAGGLQHYRRWCGLEAMR